MKPIKKKELSQSGQTIHISPNLNQRPIRETLAKGIERGILATNIFAIQCMQENIEDISDLNKKLVKDSAKQGFSVLKDLKQEIKTTFGPNSDFAKDMKELRDVTRELKTGISEIVKDWLSPPDAVKHIQERQAQTNSGQQMFSDLTESTRTEIAKQAPNIKPASSELIAISQSHDIVDAVESELHVTDPQADKLAVNYINESMQSKGYILQQDTEFESYDDAIDSLKSTAQQELQETTKPTKQPAQYNKSTQKTGQCQHNMRGLELKSDTDQQQTCEF